MIFPGSKVTWTRPGRYPVTGIARNFTDVHQDSGPVPAAAVLVTADAGLYCQGDLITVPVGELEVTAP